VLLALAHTQVLGQDSEGCSALCVTAGLSDEWLIKTLLKKHRDARVQVHYGNMLLQYARDKKLAAPARCAEVMSDARDRVKVEVHAAGSAGGSEAATRVSCLTKSGLEKKQGGHSKTLCMSAKVTKCARAARLMNARNTAKTPPLALKGLKRRTVTYRRCAAVQSVLQLCWR